MTGCQLLGFSKVKLESPKDSSLTVGPDGPYQLQQRVQKNLTFLVSKREKKVLTDRMALEKGGKMRKILHMKGENAEKKFKITVVVCCSL